MNNCDCYEYDGCENVLSATVVYQEPGYSAYEIAVQNGFVGTEQEWLDSLGAPALEAAEIALAAADTANEAATAADTAANGANQAATSANQAAAAANQSAQNADDAADGAITATQNADQAAQDAIAAGTFAEQATEAAVVATVQAVDATQDAITATNNAISATENAETATGLTNQAIADAEAATENANDAAAAVQNAKPWYYVTARVADGADRVVDQLVDYAGGTGTKPTAFIGQYLGETGFVLTKAEAKNVLGPTGPQGAAGGLYSNVVDFTTARTLILTDAAKVMKANFTVDTPVTIPANASVAFPLYTRMEFRQMGAGRIVMASAPGVTILTPGGRKVSEIQYARFDLFKVDTNTWMLEGRLIVDALPTFKAAVLADGGTINDTLLTAEFNAAMNATFRGRAVVLLICGAWKTNVLYGFNPQNGDIVTFTFGRPAVANYWDNAGIMQSAVAGQPRFDYNPANITLLGSLFENTSQNLLTQSGFLNGLSDASQSYSATAVDTLWAKGTKLNKGLKIVRDPGATAFAYKAFVTTTGVIYTFSFFVKTSDGTIPTVGNVAGRDLVVNCANILNGTSVVTNMGDGIYKIDTTVTEVLGANRAFGVIKYPSSSAKDIVVTGYDLRVGSTSDSYIETTTGQVTRIADTLVSVNDIISLTAGSVYMHFDQIKDGAGTQFLLTKGSATAGRFFYNSSPAALAIYDGVNIAQYSSGLTLSSPTKAVSSFGAGGLTIKVGANAIVKNASFDGDMGTPGSPMNLSMTNGKIIHIRVLGIFNEQLSDADQLTITTT